jgi:hemerythrin-like domain-containing protein
MAQGKEPRRATTGSGRIDMPATAVLKEEHGGIEVMLGILEKVCDLLQEGGYPESEHIDGILDFLQVFVDTCHHGKEEEVLFPALEKATCYS